METIARDRQTLFDVQLIVSGSIENVMTLSAINDLSLTDDLEDGQILSVGSVVSDKVVQQYSNRSISPATALSEEVAQALGGIGYMRVAIDFVIS